MGSVFRTLVGRGVHSPKPPTGAKIENTSLKKYYKNQENILNRYLCKIIPLKKINHCKHDFCDTSQQQSLPRHGSGRSFRGSGSICTPGSPWTPRITHWFCCQHVKHGFESSHDQLWSSADYGRQGR